MTIRPKVEICRSSEELYQAAAACIVSTLEGAVRQRGGGSFVLSGGNTPKSVYELLAMPPWSGQLDWSRIQLFWGDERCVPPEDPSSNYGAAWKAFISRLSIPSSNIHRIPGELDDPRDAAQRYEAEIRLAFTHESPPAFDLVLLGMGEDGHTASLFPGTTWDEQKWVIANFVPKLNASRISMTPCLLNGARKIVFLTSGPSKARALAGVLEDRDADYPAKRIQPRRGDLTWIVDSAAAALLRHESR